MTKQEELSYLFGILSEASKWTASPDDPRDLVRMEVEERVANLVQGITPEPDENGLIQSTIHPDNPVDEPLTDTDFQAMEAATLNEHLAPPKKAKPSRNKWERDRVRVFIDGKHVWKPRSQCVKQPRDNSNGGSLWKWVWVGPQDKKAQEEQMWAEHERY